MSDEMVTFPCTWASGYSGWDGGSGSSVMPNVYQLCINTGHCLHLYIYKYAEEMGSSLLIFKIEGNYGRKIPRAAVGRLIVSVLRKIEGSCCRSRLARHR